MLLTPRCSDPALSEADRERITSYLLASLSPATRAAYATDWQSFTVWCAEHDVLALQATPAQIASWLSSLAEAGRKASGIARARAALSHAFQGQEHNPVKAPGVERVMAGIRRTLGTAPTRKQAATAEIVRDMLAHCPSSLSGQRDQALLTLGFSGALRRSELVALTTDDLRFQERGMLVTIRRSKTDQDGSGQVIGIPNGRRLRPVDAVRSWLAASGITQGPVFRSITRHGHLSTQPLSDRSVATIVKTYAHAAGYDPRGFSGHSLRAGFVTSGAQTGQDALALARVTRHKNLSVLQTYVRDDAPFLNHPGAAFL